MIRPVRAAAIAAAAITFAASAVWAGPLQAEQGNFAPVTPYTVHAAADPGASDLGLNDEAAETAPAPDAGDMAEHMVALANAAMPFARTLDEQVEDRADAQTQGIEEECLANAVYFEARGESLEGQLAVAEVVMNRAASGRYPATLCAVVRQPWQFSFVRGGVIPRADRGSAAWRKAVAIARIAQSGASRMLAQDVLWYHADYVAPSWGRRLARTSQIGTHIFYRS